MPAAAQPTVSSAATTTSGGGVTIVFSGNLNFSQTAPNPAPSAWTLTVDGTARPLRNARIFSLTEYVINPVDGILTGQTVSVSYTKPATNALQAADGTEIASFTNQTVTNASTNAARPTFSSASMSANGQTVILDFSEALATVNLSRPPASAFSVTLDGTALTINSVLLSGGDVWLRLAADDRVAKGETVQVSYDRTQAPITSTSGPLGDPGSSRVESFTNQAVSTSTVVSPEVSSAETTADGAKIRLRFDPSVAGTAIPLTAAFTVEADGTAVSVSSIAESGSVVELTLASAITLGQSVTVSYDRSAAGSGTNGPLEAFANNTEGLVADFTNQAVVNKVPFVSNTGQTLASGSLTAGGAAGAIQALAFTTGDHAPGYTLSEVDVWISSVSAPNTRVSIYSTTSSGDPDSSLHVLTNPSSLTSDASNTFSAPAGASLAANTTYAVVVEIASGQNQTLLGRTTSDAEDAGAASGWSIADTRRLKLGSAAWSQPSASTVPLIAIRGAAITPTTFVSNAGQTAGGVTITVGGTIARKIGQPFTTGSNPNGYVLTGVDVGLGATAGATSLRVSVYTTDAAGEPASSLHALTNPAAFTANAANTFRAPANAKLLPGTTYAVVVESTSTAATIAMGHTFSNGEDSGAAAAWSIGDDTEWSENAGAWVVNGVELLISIKGAELATPEVSISGGMAVAEGGSAKFTVRADPVPTGDLTVNLEIGPMGSSFVASGDLGSKTVVIGAMMSEATYSVPTDDDTDDEPNGTVTATLAAGTGYTLDAANTSASVVVNDDDGPPPATPVVSISRSHSAVTEGGSFTFTVSAFPAPATNLSVNLTVTQTGSFVAPGTPLGPRTVTVQASSNSATFTVNTFNDDTDEPNGAVRAELNAGTDYTRHATSRSASVTVNDNDDPQSPDQPGPEGGGDQTLRREPRPLQLALWNERPGYRAGETVRLYRTLDPHDDRGRYRTFVYLETAGGGERRYLAPLSAHGQLRAAAVDSRGVAAGASAARNLYPADRELAWEGAAPAPGLWQFVMELRPAAEEEDPGDGLAELRRTRRAWAKFVVAERSQLLNRSGFDREVETDMTLGSDTLHYLGHQLFVRAGATLTLEPGTLVQAWGAQAAIIVEPGGRLVAEGTREAPVVLTCSDAVGQRRPGCWGGLRILGQAPVTRLQGLAPGVLPPERAAYGGSDGEGSSGVLRYVRVEFAGGGGEPQAPLPAIGLYGAGSGTVLDRVQVRASLGDGFAFHGGSAVCGHCVADGSGGAGLSWQRGWRGGASHLYVQHGRGGRDGLAGGHDAEGHDREPRSLPSLSNVTLVHAMPYGRHERRAVALRLSLGSGVQARDLLALRFGGGALRAAGRSRLLFGEGLSSLSGALLWLNGAPQIPGSLAEQAEFAVRNPQLRDVRGFANPDPRPKAGSPALTDERNGYIGAFSRTHNWLNEWTVFGPESVYDLRQRDDEGN